MELCFHSREEKKSRETKGPTSPSSYKAISSPLSEWVETYSASLSSPSVDWTFRPNKRAMRHSCSRRNSPPPTFTMDRYQNGDFSSSSTSPPSQYGMFCCITDTFIKAGSIEEVNIRCAGGGTEKARVIFTLRCFWCGVGVSEQTNMYDDIFVSFLPVLCQESPFQHATAYNLYLAKRPQQGPLSIPGFALNLLTTLFLPVECIPRVQYVRVASVC